MKSLRAALCLLGLLAALPAIAKPKNVILSDSLLANADKWDVKQGAEVFGKRKWHFGDYAVAAQQGWTTGGTHTNFFKTKMENRTVRKFSMVLTNQTTDSAFVHAAHEIAAKSEPGYKVGHGWSVGGKEGTEESDRFGASISLNGDTTAAWELLIGSTDVVNRQGDSMTGGTHSATLTQGERQIVLNPVFSKKFDKRPSFGTMFKIGLSPPAMGYEFVEEGRSLCAVEYFSEGLGGSHKNTVWMDRNVDPRLQLVLAAAMTAVLQMESAVFDAPAEPEGR